MTREEAVIILDGFKNNPLFSDTHAQAFDMAISALSENKGEWERISGGSFIDVYRCSKCKHEPPKKPLPDIKTWGWDFTNYCPNCGAKMERGE